VTSARPCRKKRIPASGAGQVVGDSLGFFLPLPQGSQIGNLEDRSGSLSLNRSTRQSLTYLDHCCHPLEEAEADDAPAEAALTAHQSLLRIAASLSFETDSLAPAIVRFIKTFLENNGDLVPNERMVDLLEEGLAAIRVGALSDSTMLSRSVVPHASIVSGGCLGIERRDASRCQVPIDDQ
jgi:DNA-binding transcriptional LysR family regulator